MQTRNNQSNNGPSNELEVFEQLICAFTGGILRRAREIPTDKWNWSFSERTPSAREICEHAWMWLRNDRQEISAQEPKAIPDTPEDRLEMLNLLEAEMEAWRELIRSLDATTLDEIRHSPDGFSRSIRGTLFHMAQHIVSKSGQMTMIHFELGLDGGEPYSAPHPNSLFGLAPTNWPAPRN